MFPRAEPKGQVCSIAAAGTFVIDGAGRLVGDKADILVTARDVRHATHYYVSSGIVLVLPTKRSPKKCDVGE